MRRSNPELVREMLLERNEMIRGLPTFGEPTAEQIQSHQSALELIKPQMHKTDRGKREISLELDMRIADLEEILKGKSILDIGCGKGIFAAEAARLKRTKVTALDYDPEMLARVPKAPNITVVEGSGYDLQAALGDEKFDVVVNSSSTLLWAKTSEEKSAATDSALRACNIGGKALLIPIVSNPTIREISRKGLEDPRNVSKFSIPGFGWVTTEHREEDLGGFYANNWFDVLTLEKLLGYEADGAAECTFVGFADNHRGDLRQERYSAIVDVVAELPVAC